MRRSFKSANPFYILLVLVGLAFVVTAAAYTVMAVRTTQAPPAAAHGTTNEHPLLAWLNRHGNTALLAELALLGACTFAAIGTDDFWQRRAAAHKQQHPTHDNR